MSLTSMTGSCRLLYYRTPIEIEWLPVTCERDRKYIIIVIILLSPRIYIYERKWRPGRDMVRVLVGVRGYVLRPTGHSLFTLFSLSVSVKDRPLHWTLGKSQTYYPEHILVYGCREGLLLSCHGFWLFPDWLIGGGDGGGLSTTLSLGLRSGGLESKFGWGPRPLTGEWWVGPACA